MNIKQTLISLTLLMVSLSSAPAIAALKPLDHIVAVVNEDVIENGAEPLLVVDRHQALGVDRSERRVGKPARAR